MLDNRNEPNNSNNSVDVYEQWQQALIDHAILLKRNKYLGLTSTVNLMDLDEQHKSRLTSLLSKLDS